MREDSYTEDFADICSCGREREILIQIMRAWGEGGLPDDFSDDRVRPAFNRISGHVFLVNDDSQVCMLRDGGLESWYYLSHGGDEGFFDDLVREYPHLHHEDQEYLRQIAEIRGESIPEVTDAND